MKVTGFTFIRNALKYDYPIVEAITSVLPLCDEFVIAVGHSEDDTLRHIKNITTNKIRIIETEWDDSLREGGRVLAEETNKALAEVSADSDWAFYIQADEMLHEKFYDEVRQQMLRWKDDKNVDGLLFNYRHFYGSYDFVGESYRWYRREIRIVRPGRNIYSYKDAQGFRKGNNEKLNVKLINAEIYHYGWVKPPQLMQRKQEYFNTLWHDNAWMEKNIAKAEEFDYSNIDALRKFTGTHPKVMQQRVAEKNWAFNYDPSKNRFSLKEKFKRFVEKLTGYRIGEYRNYKIV